MAFDITGFTGALIGDGARPNLFQVTMNFPRFVTAGQAAALKGSFTINAAQLPETNLGTVSQYYFGREVKLAGNRTYTPWTVSIINDEDFLLRSAFEEWVAYINSPEGNVRDLAAATLNGLGGNGYGQNATVIQFSKTGVPIKQYNFVGLFPANISPIDLNWQANDQLEEFQVTFDYQYFTTSGPSGAIASIAATIAGELLS